MEETQLRHRVADVAEVAVEAVPRMEVDPVTLVAELVVVVLTRAGAVALLRVGRLVAEANAI